MADTNPNLSKMTPETARLILRSDEEFELPFTPLTPSEKSWQKLSLTGFETFKISQTFERLGVRQLTWIIKVKQAESTEELTLCYAMEAQTLRQTNAVHGPRTLRSLAMIHLRRALEEVLRGERPPAADGIVFLTSHGWIERVENCWFGYDF